MANEKKKGWDFWVNSKRQKKMSEPVVSATRHNVAGLTLVGLTSSFSTVSCLFVPVFTVVFSSWQKHFHLSSFS